MRLQDSKLCVNCESIFEENGHCPYCSSDTFLRLAQVLGTVLGPSDYRRNLQRRLKNSMGLEKAETSNSGIRKYLFGWTRLDSLAGKGSSRC